MNSIVGWVAANPVLTDISVEAARKRPKVGGSSFGIFGLCCCVVVIAIVVIAVILIRRRKQTPPH